MLPRGLREHGMSAKAFLGVVPVFWFGGLAIYLYRVNQSLGDAAQQQLMPTIIGLGAISLALGVPILFKLMRLASGSTAKPKGRKTPDVSARGGFDPDAAIARYLERKAAGEVTFEVPESVTPRPVFGRKPV